ncbi:MAG: ribosome silencing factor [Actinomycetota bacterium]|jgi:ribosome-associated protein
MSDMTISQAIATAAAEAARDKQAADVVVLDVAALLTITDYFVICSVASGPQLKAVTEAVEERVRTGLDRRPVRREGDADGGWLLLDYIDVVVHVFGEEQREYYDLERLWSDAPRPAWAAAGARSAG